MLPLREIGVECTTTLRITSQNYMQIYKYFKIKGSILKKASNVLDAIFYKQEDTKRHEKSKRTAILLLFKISAYNIKKKLKGCILPITQ
jgi:hypothetical protein